MVRGKPLEADFPGAVRFSMVMVKAIFAITVGEEIKVVVEKEEGTRVGLAFGFVSSSWMAQPSSLSSIRAWRNALSITVDAFLGMLKPECRLCPTSEISARIVRFR